MVKYFRFDKKEWNVYWDAKKEVVTSRKNMFPMLHSDQEPRKNDNILKPCYFQKALAVMTSIYIYYGH